jgi:membrane protease YdiL (CAAX protease family)
MSTSEAVIAVPRHPQWRLTGTIMWGILIAIVYEVVQAIVVVISVFSNAHALSQSEFAKLLASAEMNGTILSWATIASTTVCLALIAAVIKLKRGARLAAYLCIHSVRPKTMLKWLVILGAFILLSELLTSAFGRPVVNEFMTATYATANPLWLWWLALIVAAPLFEEAFFRGFLFTGIESSFAGPAGAIVVTAVCWALIHGQYDAYETLTIFFIGILFGIARFSTGSLIVPIGLHAIANLVAIVEVDLL